MISSFCSSTFCLSAANSAAVGPRGLAGGAECAAPPARNASAAAIVVAKRFALITFLSTLSTLSAFSVGHHDRRREHVVGYRRHSPVLAVVKVLDLGDDSVADDQ